MVRRMAGLCSAIAVGLALAQAPNFTVLRDGFDARPGWRRGPASAVFREEAHALTQQFAHSAPSSEYLRVQCDDAARELNPFVHYVYPTPPAAVEDETAGSVWVRASRPGVQLLARVVLPRERDPADAAAPLTLLVAGDRHQLAGGRWQRLEVRRVPQLVGDERQRLRTRLNKDIDIGGAYIDQLVLNVFTGPGATELWVDDLEISPVAAGTEREPAPATVVSRSKDAAAQPPPGVKAIGPAAVEFQRDQLRVAGRAVLFRGVRHTDTPIKALRDAGLNTLFVSGPAGSAAWDEATRQGFWLVPEVPTDGDPEAVGRDVSRFATDDAVLAWHLGEWRSAEQLPNVSRTAAAVRAADPQRPVSCDVRDSFWSYSRHVDLVGAHRWPLFTTLELSRYRDWLTQRRNLCRPNTFVWSWVQTHLPDWYLDVVQPARNVGGFTEPVGPHPEQVRVLTYLSLAAGARGIAYYSDRALSDAQQGRDRLLTIALLNQELSLLEPLLVSAVDPPTWVETSLPKVKAAVIRCERGVLVMPVWLGDSTQFVPEQGAAARLSIVVPQVPVGTLAWEVSPGEVRSLPVERVVGGTKVTLSEFDHTAAIVFTADTTPTGLVVRWQDLSRRMAATASQWTYDLANVMLAKTERVQAQLTQLQVAVPDSEPLLRQARERLASSRSAWEAGDHRQAYREAQRAQRPLRVLARDQWASLTKGLDTPAASPFAVSYFALPQHVAFVRQVAAASPGQNLLTDGDFEAGRDGPTGWQVVKNTLDDVDLAVKLIPEGAEGKQALRLKVTPKPAAAPAGGPAPPVVAPVALERTFLAAESEAVRLTPGSLVKVSFSVRVPRAIQASADGLVVYDSAAGEALGVRVVGPLPQWKRFALYRRVPADGEIRVIAAMTGLGVADVDEVRIEPLATR